MQDFHVVRAQGLLEHAQEIVSPSQVQDAVRHVADVLNTRFKHPDNTSFPLVLGVMVGQPFRVLNSDGVLHNVHSLSKVNRSFNMAMLPTTMP